MACTPLPVDPVQDKSARAEWYGLLRQYKALEADRHNVTDESIDLAGELVEKLMDLPAPNHAALVWKLDYLLEPRRADRSSPSWRKAFVMQTVLDYHCILGDAA